eukprot:gene7973-7373_t
MTRLAALLAALGSIRTAVGAASVPAPGLWYADLPGLDPENEYLQ